jgi:hypothetical protein
MSRRMTRAELEEAGPYPKEAHLEGSDATGWEFVWYFGYNHDGTQHVVYRRAAEEAYIALNRTLINDVCNEVMAAPPPPRNAFEMRLMQREERAQRPSLVPYDEDEEVASPRDPRRLPG